MHKDLFFASHGAGQIHVCRWEPEGVPRAVVQIVHGIAEFAQRYEIFAEYLTELGFLVVAEDHMGHGQSIGEGPQGYFHGGWFAAVEDTYRLLLDTRKEFPGLPYILFGHSMGSFMVRTILCKYPDSGISAAVICGTGWQPQAALPALIRVVEGICRHKGEENPDPKLHKMIFGGYNRQIKNPRTPNDWLTRDDAVVDAYNAHPLCGFVPACGLLRDMMKGIFYIQQPENLKEMKKHLPVLFIAGKEDPVGNYSKGVEQAAAAFHKAGMVNITVRLYPACRHEILNELNSQRVFDDIAAWLKLQLKGIQNA
ncbi:MAG: alpha/beta fold hydrolase [Clostridia bacterium]|nr:alpha/beta fold hydrolase [Clostridia bacterium]